MKNAIRPVAIAGAVTLAFAALLVAPWLHARQTRSESQDKTRERLEGAVQSVEVIHPRRETMVRTLEGPADIEAIEQADLFAKVSGYVSEVRVDIGDRAREGDVLATLEVPELDQELIYHESMKSAKQAGRMAALAFVEQARKDHSVAMRKLHRKKAELSLVQAEFRRNSSLFTDKAITAQDWEVAQADHEIAQRELEIFEADVLAAEAKVRSTDAAASVAASEVAVVEAQIEKTRAMLEFGKITAPFDGIVTRRLVDRGALVQAATASRGAPLFTVQRTDRLRIVLEVPEPDVPFVQEGTEVLVKPYGRDGEPLRTSISRFARSLNPKTRTMRAEIHWDNVDGRLMHGMYANVAVEIERSENALTIPASALLTKGSETFVYVVDGELARKVPIEIGLDDGIRVEVKKGLEEEDWVVLTGKNLVSPDSHVRGIPAGGR